MSLKDQWTGALGRWVGLGLRRHLVAVVLLVAAVTLPFAWMGSLPFDNDCLYGDAIRDVRENGHLLTPAVHGVPFIDKPPLHFWTGALSTALLGESEFSLRLPASIAAILACLAVFLLVRELVDTDRSKERERLALAGGWAAVLLLLGTRVFFEYSLRNYMEVPVAACAAWSLLALIRADRTEGKQTLWWAAVAGVACGAGVMLKSVVGLVGVSGFVVWMVASGRWARLLRPSMLLASGVAALVFVPWHAIQASANAQVFLDFQYRLHVTDQIMNAQPWSTGGPMFYVLDLWATEKPLLSCLAVALVVTLWRLAVMVRREGEGEETLASSPVATAAIMALVPLVVFSVSETKKDLYVVAFAPMLAVWSAVAATTLVTRLGSRARRTTWFAALALCALAFVWSGARTLDPFGPVLDGSPGQKAIGEALREDAFEQGDVDVHLIGIMPVAIQFYSGLPAVMWTDDESYLEQVSRIPYIRYAGNVRLGGYVDVRQAMEKDRKAYGVASPRGLLRIARGKPWIRVVAHAGGLVLFRNFDKGEGDLAMAIDELERQGVLGGWPLEAVMISADELRVKGRFKDAAREYRIAMDMANGERERVDAMRALGETLYWLDRREEAATVLGGLGPKEAGRRAWEMLADLAWLDCRSTRPDLQMLFRELVSGPDDPAALRMMATLPPGCSDAAGSGHGKRQAQIFEMAGRAFDHTAGAQAAVLVVLDDPTISLGQGYLVEVLDESGLGGVAAVDVDALDGESEAPVILWASSRSPAVPAVFSHLDAGRGLVVVGADASSLLDGAAPVRVRPASSAMLVMPGESPFRVPVDVTTMKGGQGVDVLATMDGDPVAVAMTGEGRRVASIGFEVGKAVVILRQGDPTLAGCDTDGISGITPLDLFSRMANASDHRVPRADMLVKLLVDAIEIVSPRPLPVVGTLPPGTSGVMVLTADQDFADSEFLVSMAAEVKARTGGTGAMTFYLTSGTQQEEFRAGANLLTDPETEVASRLISDGHELAVHTNLTAFAGSVDAVPALVSAHVAHVQRAYGVHVLTARNHRLSWSGWVGTAAIEEGLGILMDLNFNSLVTVTTPGPGYVNGSALPMRFVGPDGRLMGVLQQSTHLGDDALPSASIKSLGMEIHDGNLVAPDLTTYTRMSIEFAGLAYDRRLPLVVSHHPIHFARHPSWLRALLDHASGRRVSVWTALDWLDFWLNRALVRFTDPTWAEVDEGMELGFTMSVLHPGGDAQQVRAFWVVLPSVHHGLVARSATLDGQAATLDVHGDEARCAASTGQVVRVIYAAP